MEDSRFSITVAGVCFLTSVAAVVSVFTDAGTAATVAALVSTNIAVLLGLSKANETHKETLRLTNGGLAKAIKDASDAQLAERHVVPADVHAARSAGKE